MFAVSTVTALLVAAPPAPQHVIPPGHERAFRTVLVPQPGELPDGWAVHRVRPTPAGVEALYGPRDYPPGSCASAPLCLELVHPTSAPDLPASGGFALRARGASSASALLAGVSTRLAAAGLADVWRATGAPAATAEAADPDAATPEAETQQHFRDLLGDLGLSAEVRPDRVVFTVATADGGTDTVTLEARRPGHAVEDEVTPRFSVHYGPVVGADSDLRRRLHAELTARDDGSLRLLASTEVATHPPLQTWLIRIAGVILLLLALLLPSLLRAAWGVLRPHPLALAALALGGLALLLLPTRLVQLGLAYAMTDAAAALRLPRYGAGAPVLHALSFAAAGVDHEVLVWTHRVAAILTLPLAGATGVLLLRDLLAGRDHSERVAVVTWCTALALTPMLLRSGATESNMVPTLLGVWVALASWLGTTGAVRVVGTAVGLAWAGLCRPEMVAIGPLAWLVLGRPWRSPVAAASVAALAAAPLALQVAYVGGVVGAETASGALHLDRSLSLEQALGRLAYIAPLDPRIAPVAVPVLALVACRSRLALATLGLGLIWMWAYTVDISPASLPRLHITGLTLWSLLGATAVGLLWARQTALGAAALLFWSLSAVATIPTLWAATNEDTEEAWLARARAALPEGGDWRVATLASSDAPDPPGHWTHRYLPTYRFPEGSLLTLDQLDALPDPAGAYYLQRVSCYARLHRARTDETGLLERCALVHHRYQLEPLVMWEVPNHGNPVHQELGYYGRDEGFSLGLYRVIARR